MVAPGDSVQVCGLKGRTDLNGLRGVLGGLAANGRFEVTVFKNGVAEKVSLKLDNVVPVAGLGAEAGPAQGKVRIDGIKGRKELNGLTGVCQGKAANGRFFVTLVIEGKAETVSLNIANVFPFTQQDYMAEAMAQRQAELAAAPVEEKAALEGALESLTMKEVDKSTKEARGDEWKPEPKPMRVNSKMGVKKVMFEHHVRAGRKGKDAYEERNPQQVKESVRRVEAMLKAREDLGFNSFARYTKDEEASNAFLNARTAAMEVNTDKVLGNMVNNLVPNLPPAMPPPPPGEPGLPELD